MSPSNVKEPGHIRSPKVELRPVIGEERRVSSTFLLGQDIDLALKLGVRLDRAGLGQDLARAPLDPS